MAKYIDKVALVAEIERRVTEGEKVAKVIPSSAIMGLIQAYNNTLSFIDTLEVKEIGVDFGDPKGDKSAKFIIDTKSREAKEVDFVNEFYTFSDKHKFMDKGIEFADIEKTASFFFQLGILASNPITAADRGTAEEIIINLKRVEKDYHINLTREISWLNNKVKLNK